MIKTLIKSGYGDNYEAKVTSRGQLVVAPLEYSEAYNATAGTDNTAAVLVSPKVGQRFVITGMILKANQSVSNTVDATVDIYEATSDTSTTIAKSIFQTQMVRGDRLVLTALNIITTENVWISIKTTDDDVYCTIFGYYVEA